MPSGRYQRLALRGSSPYCSTTTIVVFVAFCLVGVWMMTSSTVSPADVSLSNRNSDGEQKVSDMDVKPFEDKNGDASEDTLKGDSSTNPSSGASEGQSESSQNKIEPGETIGNEVGKTQGVTSDKGNEGTDNESAGTSKTETYDDANGKLENGMMVKEGGEVVKESGDSKSEGGNKNTWGQEERSDNGIENNFSETTSTELAKSTGPDSDQTINGEQVRNSGNNEQEKTAEKNADGTENSEKVINSEKNPEQTEISGQESKPDGDPMQDNKAQGQSAEVKEPNQVKDPAQNSDEETTKVQAKEQVSNELLPSGAQIDLQNESNTQNGDSSTQASESKNEKAVQASSASKEQIVGYNWKLCNATAGADYIPCLDNEEAVKKLGSTKHYEHRERHCPEIAPTCLVPLPDGYKKSIQWPSSRDKIWYHNVPHSQLAAVKGHQNWVKVTGEYLTFPGGGTQFIHGALHYIDVIQQALPDIAWGKRSRVALDVGCGVASFGGYLFDRDVITMSFAPKDEHEAQVQFALERGIPAISAVMGTQRLPFPGRVFDIIHCARCRVPWHIEGGMLLLELNRLLRPGGYFIWSATPVYRTGAEDVQIWNATTALMKSMCWDMVVKTMDTEDQVGLAIFRKSSNNSCYETRKESSPPFCQESDDPNAAWNVRLQACMHKLPVDAAIRGSKWPEKWPLRLESVPYWLNSSQVGVYGKPAPQDFKADQEHWNTIVSKSYLNGMGIDWSKVRNVLDMRSVYGGFAAALRDMKLWVMNIVPIDSPDTLPIIYERGLFGMYHDWCESFSTYPRSYDLLHADHLFSSIKKRCKLLPLMVEVDRILRPEGKLIIRDSPDVISEVESIARSLNWEIRMTFSKLNEGILCVMKTAWRPKEVEVRR